MVATLTITKYKVHILMHKCYIDYAWSYRPNACWTNGRNNSVYSYVLRAQCRQPSVVPRAKGRLSILPRILLRVARSSTGARSTGRSDTTRSS